MKHHAEFWVSITWSVILISIKGFGSHLCQHFQCSSVFFFVCVFFSGNNPRKKKRGKILGNRYHMWIFTVYISKLCVYTMRVSCKYNLNTHLCSMCNMRWPHLWTNSEHPVSCFLNVSTNICYTCVCSWLQLSVVLCY